MPVADDPAAAGMRLPAEYAAAIDTAHGRGRLERVLDGITHHVPVDVMIENANAAERARVAAGGTPRHRVGMRRRSQVPVAAGTSARRRWMGYANLTEYRYAAWSPDAECVFLVGRSFVPGVADTDADFVNGKRGEGLFALTDIPMLRAPIGMNGKQRMRTLLHYTGERMTEPRFRRRYGLADDADIDSADAPYTVRLTALPGDAGVRYVDARNAGKSGVARYINHQPTSRANCRLLDSGRIVQVHAIAAYEELTYAYSASWQMHFARAARARRATSADATRADADSDSDAEAPDGDGGSDADEERPLRDLLLRRARAATAAVVAPEDLAELAALLDQRIADGTRRRAEAVAEADGVSALGDTARSQQAAADAKPVTNQPRPSTPAAAPP